MPDPPNLEGQGIYLFLINNQNFSNMAGTTNR